MDRRTALMMTALLGGWLPRGVFAQGAGRRVSSKGTITPKGATSRRPSEPESEPEKGGGSALLSASESNTDDSPPGNFPTETGQKWQNFDIAFRAARFDGEKKTENARITVYQNGALIHDDYSIPDKTGAGEKEGPEPRPIKLQGHHNPVRFRNVWIQKLSLDAEVAKPAAKQ